MKREVRMSLITSKKSFTFLVLMMVLLTYTATYSQDVVIDTSSTLVFSDGSTLSDKNPIRVVTPLKNSNVNFILWFMGTKEDVNTKISNESFSKKSFLTSGRELNHLLLKTLLKKAMNSKTC
jgi:hypothetical protein